MEKGIVLIIIRVITKNLRELEIQEDIHTRHQHMLEETIKFYQKILNAAVKA
jgi:hypothetical protein